MPTGPISAGRNSGRATTRAGTGQRVPRLVATLAVLVLVGGGGAVDRSRSTPTSYDRGPGATELLAHDNFSGANASPRPSGGSPSASRGPKSKPKPRTSAGFSASSAYIPGSGRVYLGAAGDSQALARSTGMALSDHSYAHFGGGVPAGRMITVKASGNWRSVATAVPGSATYNDIVRWARTIKTRSGTTMFAYHHEPEGANSRAFGTPVDFIQAWRRVVTIFRAEGVRNVIYTWQMTAWAFRTSPGDSRYAARWYPGDDYVDSVGADAYNWGPCGEGRGRWEELKTLGDPVLAFARAHGKPASFPEFASHADPRRAQWTYNALQYIAANRGSIVGAFYFHRPPTVTANNDCKWPLAAAAEYHAYSALGRNRAYFTP